MSSNWIIDTGATSHMFSNKLLFHTFHSLSRPIELC
ncbi:hypothetical protein, partial [Vibrio vulnificus]